MINFTKIIDISLPLTHKTIVYPGNPPVTIEQLKSAGGTSVLSKIAFGSHTGTHVDAPRHVFPDGKTIDQISLTPFIGPCRILDATNEKEAVSLELVTQNNINKDDRVLFKTSNSLRGFQEFYNDYVFLSGAAAKYLAEKEVALVGIDYLSVKQRMSQDDTPHTHLLSRNIPILEGIDLSRVTSGIYFLVALPLNFIGLEASPVRAVLFDS